MVRNSTNKDDSLDSLRNIGLYNLKERKHTSKTLLLRLLKKPKASFIENRSSSVYKSRSQSKNTRMRTEYHYQTYIEAPYYVRLPKISLSSPQNYQKVHNFLCIFKSILIWTLLNIEVHAIVISLIIAPWGSDKLNNIICN